jgi:hypothetical protein
LCYDPLRFIPTSSDLLLPLVQSWGVLRCRQNCSVTSLSRCPDLLLPLVQSWYRPPCGTTGPCSFFFERWFPRRSRSTAHWPVNSRRRCLKIHHLKSTEILKFREKLVTLLDLCVSSLRRGHANLLCIVPILTDDLRRGSNTLSTQRGHPRGRGGRAACAGGRAAPS